MDCKEKFNILFTTLIDTINPQHIIISISGGVDSLVLTDLIGLYKKNYPFKSTVHALYIIHDWIGRKDLSHEIVKEIELSRKLCEKYNIIFSVHNPSDYQLKLCNRSKRESTESYARLERKEILSLYAQDLQDAIFCTGHHRDDRIAHFFIKIMRGSSLTGISSFSYFNDRYIRPLWHCTKEEIKKYALDNAIEYVDDSANYYNDLLRNKINNIIIPFLYDQEPRCKETIIRTLDTIADAYSYTKKKIEEDIGRIYNKQNKKIDIDLFLKEDYYCQSEIIIYALIDNNIQTNDLIKKSLIDEIIRFFKTDGKKHSINNITLIKIKEGIDNYCFFN